MAKRFTSTEIWDEDWFIEMPLEYKLFWFYILSRCDHAGLFRANVSRFTMLSGTKVLPFTALKYFNAGKERIRVVSDSVWLIEDFFSFQYGETFNPNNKVHESIQKAYNQHNIKMTSIRGLKDHKERTIDKDKDKERKGGSGEKQKGIKFSEDFTFVSFADGSKQDLGESQYKDALRGNLSPRSVIKGNIY